MKRPRCPMIFTLGECRFDDCEPRRAIVIGFEGHRLILSVCGVLGNYRQVVERKRFTADNRKAKR